MVPFLIPHHTVNNGMHVYVSMNASSVVLSHSLMFSITFLKVLMLLLIIFIHRMYVGLCLT